MSIAKSNIFGDAANARAAVLHAYDGKFHHMLDQSSADVLECRK